MFVADEVPREWQVGMSIRFLRRTRFLPVAALMSLTGCSGFLNIDDVSSWEDSDAARDASTVEADATGEIDASATPDRADQVPDKRADTPQDGGDVSLTQSPSDASDARDERPVQDAASEDAVQDAASEDAVQDAASEDGSRSDRDAINDQRIGDIVSDSLAPDAEGGLSVTVPPPRLLAPLSTATVTSQRPTLRWVLPAGVDGAFVQICRDCACSIK